MIKPSTASNFGETLRVVLSRGMNFLNTAGFALIAALNFLLPPAQTDAGVRVGASVADSLPYKGVIEPVHYSRRYGWHYGMWKSYGHEHKESCHRAGGYWNNSEESRCGAWRRRFGAGGRPVEN
jgi:hypothetical protein